jgi:hypothetical protein
VLVMDTKALLELYLSEHPTCRVCGNASETLRQKSNPPWGLDDESKPRTTLESWLAAANPDDITGVCNAHFKTSRAGSGWHDPDSAPRSGRGSGNWMKQNQARRHQARVDLIEALGGVCQRCGEEHAYEQMRVLIPEKSRKQYGFTDHARWWEFVRGTPALLETAELLCVGCSPLRASVNATRASARDRVVEGYGGRCWHPDCTEDEKLLVASKPGTPALRWPNGDKYNSTAKLQYLLRNDFPDGWTLTCGPHQRELQSRG